MYQFSAGSLYGINPNGTIPRKFGALQDVSVDFSFTTKSLYGQNQFALAIARGQAKVTGKAKWASLNSAMLNDLFFGSVPTATQSYMPIFGEAATIPTTPFQVTVANGANFIDDLGVSYAATGIPLTKVGASPTTGQYSVNAATGVYTFATADVGLGVLIDYTFKVTTAGSALALSQSLSGTTPTFGMVLVTKFADGIGGAGSPKPLYLNLVQCLSSKLSLATKMDDFMVPEFDFEAFANVAGSVGTFALGE